MKTKFFFVCLLACTFVSCDFDTMAENAHRFFSDYNSITAGIESAVEQAYFDSVADFNGAWLMYRGSLSGDSLHITRPDENTFLLTSTSPRGSLNLTAEMTGIEEFEITDGTCTDYHVLINGTGTYAYTPDSILTYTLNGIGGKFTHQSRIYWDSDLFYFTYIDGGEIILSGSANGKTSTYHYDLVHQHITCRQTKTTVLSYDD